MESTSIKLVFQEAVAGDDILKDVAHFKNNAKVKKAKKKADKLVKESNKLANSNDSKR